MTGKQERLIDKKLEFLDLPQFAGFRSQVPHPGLFPADLMLLLDALLEPGQQRRQILGNQRILQQIILDPEPHRL
ncbi:hypothetical protein D1872_274770 [compost metagenome]